VFNTKINTNVNLRHEPSQDSLMQKEPKKITKGGITHQNYSGMKKQITRQTFYECVCIYIYIYIYIYMYIYVYI